VLIFISFYYSVYFRICGVFTVGIYVLSQHVYNYGHYYYYYYYLIPAFHNAVLVVHELW